MGLAALDSALTGLRVSQLQINTISQNIANASTDGYTRKILPQETQASQGVVFGVKAGLVIRDVDLNLERDLWTQVSATSFYSVQESYLSRIQEFHGAPEAELSIASEIARLKDGFAALSDDPSDRFLQAAALNQAEDTARRINDLSGLITTLRNDVQTEIQTTISQINALIEDIAGFNRDISTALNSTRSTAQLEDQRDQAINELSEFIEIDFYIRGDGVMEVETTQGTVIASNRAFTFSFESSVLSAVSAYPDSINPLYVTDPLTSVGRRDITQDAVGGKLGGLLELRDVTFPKQMAQLDELAHKMALRFEEQGLLLFTDASGTIPADTAPDTSTNPVTAVEYVGFSAQIQVNDAVVNDTSLLQSGTYGAGIPPGSNEVIARVLDYTFGDIDYQLAANTVTADSVDLLNRGGVDLQTWLGLASSNTLTGGRDLSAFADPASLIASANGALDPGTDTFRITLEEARSGLGPVNIDIELGAMADGAGNVVQDIIDHINTVVIPALSAADQAALTSMNAAFSVGSNGELVIDASASLTIDGTNPANPMGQGGLDFLGLVDNVGSPIAPTDPYFDVRVGENDFTRITLEPGDTDVELIAKLQAVPGLAVDTVSFALDGFLRLRPGNDFDFPDFGGSLEIIGGPFTTNSAALGSPPATSGRTALDDGVNIVSALFGTYTAGPPVQDGSFITNVAYASETNASLGPPVPTTSFRTSYLGPDAAVSTNLISANSLIDYSQKMVFEQSSELSIVETRAEDESAFRDVLRRESLDRKGVNVDEEFSKLIVYQNSYSAAARVISAVDEAFQELLGILN